MEPFGTRYSDRINKGRHQADLRLGTRALGPSPYSRSRMGLDGGIQTTATWLTTDTTTVPSDWRPRKDQTILLPPHEKLRYRQPESYNVKHQSHAR
jgi:hypothetical protein